MLAAPVRFRLGACALVRLARPDRGNALANRNLELPFRSRGIVEVWQRDSRQPLADRLLDRAKVVLFFRRNEGKRITHGFRSRSTADAVDVIVRSLRNVEIHHVSELLDVDPAGGNIGSDEDSVLPVLEPGEGGGALRL